MKAIGRYLVVLLVACLVALAIYVPVQNNSTSQGTNMAGVPGQQSTFTPESGNTAHQAGLAEGARPRRPEGGMGGLMGLAGILKNLAVIAVATLLVSLIPKAIDRLHRRRQLQAA